MEEVRLMKGNEALALAAIRYGCDGYFGYPITPQSEVLETLEQQMPWETTGTPGQSIFPVVPRLEMRAVLKQIPQDRRSNPRTLHSLCGGVPRLQPSLRQVTGSSGTVNYMISLISTT